MKVCQLCAVDFTLKKFLLPLIDRQVAEGDEVTAVCSDGEYVQSLRDSHYHVDTISIARSMHPFKHLRSIWKLYWYFRRNSFDLVHVHTPAAALVGRIAAYLARVPFVVYTAHGFYFHDDMPLLKKRIHIGLEWFAGRFTDLLFTQSAEDAVAATNLNIMPKKSVFVIGNGVDVQRFHRSQINIRPSLDIPEDSIVIGMIGRLVEEKGVVDFLEAAMILAVDYPDAYFILVGGRLTSDHATAIDDVLEMARIKLGVQLVLTGLRDDIPELLAAMNIFCLPSWREGMPRTIIEAMMMGLPVIATDIRGSREEVIPEKTGLLVPVREVKALTYAMKRLIDNRDWADRLGMAGRERALLLYDESKVVDYQIKKIHDYAKSKGLIKN